MRFILAFIISAISAYLIYAALVVTMINAPIRAEYWVGEMIAIKKGLVKRFVGENKVIVAGGSSTLFGIDAAYASKHLNMPVVNFGLHAGLTLERILQEVAGAVESGDTLILALEPTYYDCQKPFSVWQVTNTIGWDHGAWTQMGILEKGVFVSHVSFSMFGQMILADLQQKYFPLEISGRLESLDSEAVISKFMKRTPPKNFGYSAYHLDDYGDMLRTEGAKYKGAGVDIRKPNHICPSTAAKLKNYINQLKQRGIAVYFANTPYIATGGDESAVRNNGDNFQDELEPIGRFIDKRESLVFDRKYFFNTNLHLNTEGRKIRTELFISSVRSVLRNTAQN